MKVAGHSRPSGRWEGGMLRRFSVRTALAKLLLLFSVSLGVGASLAQAQGLGGTCADGTQVGPGFDCRAYLCSTGWAQAHGLRWGSPVSSSQRRSHPIPSTNAPKYT